jgi:putative ABC transport system permease protein
MFVVAVFAVGAGAFGPIYLNSAKQSILNGVLKSAPVGSSGLTFEPKSGNRSPEALLAATSQIPQRRNWFGGAIVTNLAGVALTAGNESYVATLLARTATCDHLVIVSGHCATRYGGVLMSTRSVAELRLGLGQSIAVSFLHSSRVATLQIVGIYRPTNGNAPYWWGSNPFSFGNGSPSKPELDALFASPQTVQSAAPAALTSPMVQVPYRQGSLALSDVSAVQSAISASQRDLLVQDGIVVSTQLPQLLTQAGTTEHAMSTIVAVVDLQLVLLAIFALYFVSARTAAEREPDVRLAAIRGFRPRSTVAVAMMEPTALVLAAVPVGLLAAWLVAGVWASHFFGAGVGASMTLLAGGAAVVTGLIGVGATSIGTRRMLAEVEATTSDVSEGLSFSRWRVVADVAVIAVAGAAFFELAAVGVSGTNGMTHTDPLAAFAPGLLALALGILGARLLPLACRLTFGFTANSRKVALGLSTRRVARLRGYGSQVMLMSIAVGLTLFGISGWAIAAHNRSVQDGFDVGAAKVLTVAVRPGVDFVSAVRRGDPKGRSAMAAIVVNASSGTTLAVDSSRMPEVMSWPAGLGSESSAQIARRLVPSNLAPPVLVSGTAIRVTVDAAFVAEPAPILSLDLFDKGFQSPEQVVLGSLTPGLATYQGSLSGVCPSGCRLVDLGVTWNPPVTSVVPAGSADLLISSLATRSTTGDWEQLRAGLTDARRWQSPSGGARLSAQERGLQADVTLDPDGGPVTIAPADVPRELPAVVTPDSSIGSASALFVAGLDGGTVRARAISEVSALPRLGADANLVDLGMAERFVSGPFVDDTTEVWVSPAAPPNLAKRLAAQGISVIGVDSVTEREQATSHGGVELAYTLFLLAAIAAAAVAVGATGFAVAAGARRRMGELAALRAVGLPATMLRRSLEVEMALILGTGLLLGAVAGILAALVAVRSVPEFVSLGPGPPLELGLPTVLLAVTLGALAVALGLIVRVGAAAFVRGSSADRLGETQA